MTTIKDLWTNNGFTRWAKQIGTNRIQQQQWKDAGETELWGLTPRRGPYQQIRDGNEDTSYRPGDITFEYGNTDANDIDTKFQPQRFKRYTEGWRFGAINCAISASIVFLINFIVTIWGSAHKNANKGVLLEGDCDKVHQVNTGLHFLINLLSTILLGSSNYCMQCLSAPTRSEIDAAHAKGIWLDIGVPSVRNLRHISQKRVGLWVALGISSLPLHLFYNSAVFGSIVSNNYYAFSVSQSFIDNPECLHCNKTLFSAPIGGTNLLQTMHEKARNGTLDRFEPADCLNKYAQMIQSFRRNVLLVASDENFPAISNTTSLNGTNVYSYDRFYAMDAQVQDEASDSYRWMCNSIPYSRNTKCGSLMANIKKSPSTWKVGGYPVHYCLSEKAPPVCKLQFSVGIAILVTILNFLKGGVILYTVFYVNEEPLMTMGDAVASFIEKTDPTTRNMCILTMKDAKKHKGYFPAGPREWDLKVYRWKDVTSKTRRITTFTMYIIALVLVSILLNLAIQGLPDDRSLPALARLGYGAVDPRAIISWEVSSTTGNILMANLAQPILSFLYFSYNGLFTCMLLGLEWSQYAHQRKGLRVSRTPSGAQRSTYFLQLPYRFALPLMVLSGILHWLVSQSIFLVAIDIYDSEGRPDTLFSDSDGWKTCGYSPIAIISVLIFGIFMVAAGVGFGYWKFKPGIPLAGSCSAAISAACHSGEWDGVEGARAVCEIVQWGVVGKGGDGVGHCAFSSKEVERPEIGAVYAGRGIRKRGEQKVRDTELS
ncbi:uncharacterized protein BDR25DRAFT_279479 [Lindgomyces ingoldianus]|uniref:Uncharacterized protein n=1 Tax=Lindgomyces ingoldianus TaxID=673940 RepID=A0ACB6R8C8_9PLEO|nr:uncharacterized protein BDR25DRAFT_279479 [Lindgomyces ingoldianus]KAF2475426.1 hypothetical protein BDR25DRAFT_279479 [Lindgomyces ingoldianus]